MPPSNHLDVARDALERTIRELEEQIKQAEKGRASVFDGIPSELPALLHALKVQKKAAGLGLDVVG